MRDSEGPLALRESERRELMKVITVVVATFQGEKVPGPRKLLPLSMINYVSKQGG